MPSGQPPKFEPLRAHLAGLPADITETTLTFAELAALLGMPLPPSARGRPFWANSRVPWGGTAQAWGWQGAGWRVGAVAPGVWVTFARGTAGDRASEPPRRRSAGRRASSLCAPPPLGV